MYCFQIENQAGIALGEISKKWRGLISFFKYYLKSEKYYISNYEFIPHFQVVVLKL